MRWHRGGSNHSQHHNQTTTINNDNITTSTSTSTSSSASSSATTDEQERPPPQPLLASVLQQQHKIDGRSSDIGIGANSPSHIIDDDEQDYPAHLHPHRHHGVNGTAHSRYDDVGIGVGGVGDGELGGVDGVSIHSSSGAISCNNDHLTHHHRHSHRHDDEFDELVGGLSQQQQQHHQHQQQTSSSSSSSSSMRMSSSSNTKRKSQVPASSASSLISSLPPPDINPELVSSEGGMGECGVGSSIGGTRSPLSPPGATATSVVGTTIVNGGSNEGDNVTAAAASVLLEKQQQQQQQHHQQQRRRHPHHRRNEEEEEDDDDEEDDPGQDHAVPDEGFDGLGPSTVWRPQNQQSTCEFTHTITNYSTKRESGCKKAEYSSTTVDSFGNRWRLIVYVNGNGRASNHHLSLFLQVADADELPFGWKKAVSYVLTLEHPSGPSLGYAKRNPDKTFKLCPKAIDWGWSQFITSDRIQQEGYISNDSLTVRASVTVKSSSISIDPEDAELYLKCAVEEGNADAVEACLAQGAGVNCQFKDDLYTPLHTACSSSTSNGSLEVLKLLLKRGADGNACNKWRETPLLIAANNGHRAAVEALLENGADPSMCSEAGWSALTFAAHKGYDDIVSLLLSAGAPVNCRVIEDLSTPLHKACAGGKPGHLSAVKQLLSGGADVHALNKWRETPLLTAANHGQAAAVEALLERGGDPCKCTDTGWSPLSIAAYKGHDDVVRLLLEQGAPTEEADPTLSALLQAATKGLPETVELLLRHGADHTVTTKKGDTALSILVEQNLIDAAVEMVTEYKASVPRCSRDRKKVQRARLLINLRVKQRGNTDDDDSDQDDSDEYGSNSALHDSDTSPKAVAPVVAGNVGGGFSIKKPKGKQASKSRESAEAEAKAAEEALLLELEQEDAKAKMNEAAATSRRNKKKKKKERERQQKLEEERQKKEKEEKQAAELEQKRLKEEKDKRDRKEKARVEQEKEMREATEKAVRVQAKRKEKEKRDRERAVREKKYIAQQQYQQTSRNHPNSAPVPPHGGGKDKLPVKMKPKKATDQQTKNDSNVKDNCSNRMSSPKRVGVGSTQQLSKPNIPGSNRGWETKKGSSVPTTTVQSKRPENVVRAISSTPAQTLNIESKNRHVSAGTDRQGSSSPGASVEDMLENMANGVVGFLGFDSPPLSNTTTDRLNVPTQNKENNGEMTERITKLSKANKSKPTEGNSRKHTGVARCTSIEIPAVSVFRQKKVMEMFRRISSASSTSPSSSQNAMMAIDNLTVRSAIYKWIVRASYESYPVLDPVIPSWTDTEMLAAFFQRQLISESRRGTSGVNGPPSVNIEILKEAGSFIADLCHSLAKDVSDFQNSEEEKLPKEISDDLLDLHATKLIDSDGSSIVIVSKGGSAEVHLPEETFINLRKRYCGVSNLLLTSMFAAAKRCEIQRIITMGTNVDSHLSQYTLSAMAREMNVSMELCSNSLNVFGNNCFCGLFPDVESHFGAFRSFGCADNNDGEAHLLKQGGSAVLMPPLESNSASVYMKRVLNMLEHGVPLSFVVILPFQCFRDLTSSPRFEDLNLLDPRLYDIHSSMLSRFIYHVESIPDGQHMYDCGDGAGQNRSQTGSWFLLLQNEPGRLHFSFNDASIANIKQSMAVHFLPVNDTSVTVSAAVPAAAPVGLQSFMLDSSSGSVPSTPPNANGGIGPVSAPYGLGSRFAFNAEANLGTTRRRTRLFELVDDGDNDYAQDVEGMLNNLDIGMFQNNSSQDVDIEAISLMGIGNPSAGRSDHSATNSLGQTGNGRFG